MSRISLSPVDPDLWVTVGWDPPLGTYFAQVFRYGKIVDGEQEDDEELVWRGLPGDTILDITTVRDIVAPYVTDWSYRVEQELLFHRKVGA